MNKFEVGKVVDGINVNGEDIRIDVTDEGINLIVAFSSPTGDEIESFKTGNIQTGIFNKDDVLLFLFKFGNLAWVDVPYNVHLSKHLTGIQEIEDGEGLSLTILFIDSKTKILKALRLIGLPTRLSREIKSRIETQKQELFDIDNYKYSIQKLFGMQTKEIVNYCNIYKL